MHSSFSLYHHHLLHPSTNLVRRRDEARKMIASTSKILLPSLKSIPHGSGKLAARSVTTSSRAQLAFFYRLVGIATPPTTAPRSDSMPDSSQATIITTSTTTSPEATPSAPEPEPIVKGKMLARDEELLAKLHDRESGCAGVGIVNGKYEEGLGPETKKNMFRLI